jgi:hypothetical protein
VELRVKSDLLHLTDGWDFISCCDKDIEEIGHACLHYIAAADCSYDIDDHNYNNPDPHAGLIGDCTMFAHPQQKMMGKVKKGGATNMPTASIRERAPSALVITSPACVYTHASTLSTPTASSPGSPRQVQCVPYSRHYLRAYSARSMTWGTEIKLQQ